MLLLSFQALLGFEYMQTTEGTGVPYYVTSVQFHLMKLETPYIYFKLGVFQFPKEFLDRQFHSLDVKKAFYDNSNAQGQTPTFGTAYRDD